MDKSLTGHEVSLGPAPRKPTPLEWDFGIWADRLGSGPTGTGDKYRCLGLSSVVCVTRGRGFFQYPGEGPGELQTGDALLLHPDQWVKYGPGPEGWVTSWVVWNDRSIHPSDRTDTRFPPGSRRPTVLERHGILLREPAAFPIPLRRARQFFARLAHTTIGLAGPQALTNQKNLLEFLEFLSTCQRGKDPPIDDSMERLAHDLVHPPSLARMARASGLSPAQFRRRFHSRTGESPKAFLMRARIEEACRLAHEGLSTQAIAERVGLPDVFYFMRVFKNRTGMSLGDFRKRGGL